MKTSERKQLLFEKPGDPGLDREGQSLHFDQTVPQTVINGCLHPVVPARPVHDRDELVVLLRRLRHDCYTDFAILVIDEENDDEGQVCREEQADFVGTGTRVQSQVADDLRCIDGPAGPNVINMVSFASGGHLERPLQ